MEYEIERTGEEHAICPYCTYEHFDCFEWNCSEERIKVSCEKCSKSFEVIRQISITYDTNTFR